MKTVARVRVASVAKIALIVSGLVGVLVGVVLILGRMLLGPVSFSDFLVASFLPVLYAVSGLMLAVVGAWLYNLVAGWVGGIELELED